MTPEKPDGSRSGQLSIVATPIGNLEDITLRALRVMRDADVIAAEDTRHTKKLLRHFDIDTPIVSFHEHSPESRASALADRVAAGEHVAYVSDAGTPAVSDPGALLVQTCQERNLSVTAVPGPSALSAAIAVCGFSSTGYSFYGFLPRGGHERAQSLGRIISSPLASVFFESPHRVRETIAELAALVDNSRELVVCRELTKQFEEIRRAPLCHWLGAPPQARGEFTLVLDGCSDSSRPQVDAPARARELLSQGASARDAAKRLCFEAQLTRKEAYAIVMDAQQATKASPTD